MHPCPTPTELHAFAVGDLPVDAEADTGRHVDVCALSSALEIH